MNGNLKSVDNSKDTQGRHKDFIAVQRKVSLYLLTATAKTRQAFDVWAFLRLQANGEYNVTEQGLRKALHMSIACVSWALDYLAGIDLLTIKDDKEVTGKAQVVTANGKAVPNNQKHFTVFCTSAKLEETAIEAYAATAVCIEAEPAEEQAAASVPPRMQQTRPTQKQSFTERIQAREREILTIGRRTAGTDSIPGILSPKQEAMLLASAKEYKQKVGISAGEQQIHYMADMMLTAGVCEKTKKDISEYIENHAKRQQCSLISP